MGLKIMMEDITDTGGNEAEVAANMNATVWVQLLYQNVTAAGDRTGVQSTLMTTEAQLSATAPSQRQHLAHNRQFI